MLKIFNKQSAQAPTSVSSSEVGGKGAYIAALVSEYLKDTLQSLGEQKVKETLRGKFASLKYTLSGYDPTDLTYDEQIKMLNLLYDLNIKEKNRGVAKGELEKIVLRVKDRLGVVAAFEDALKDLPNEILAQQKIASLNEEELRKHLKESVEELEKLRYLTDENSSEKALELSAERDLLETILYNASDGVFALDRNGKIITFNKAMETMTGYTLKEVRLKPADEIVRLFESSSPVEARMYCAMPGVDPDKVRYSGDKVTLVARNGGKKYVKMASSTISEGREVNIGCIVTLKDITKDIELETMKLDFVSMAAHELRTPLTAIRGYLSMLNDEIKGDLDEEHAQYLEKSLISTDRLHVLIENLLSISRIERGALVPEKTKTDWIALVQETIDQFESNAESSDITLTFTKPENPTPEVFVDKTMIVEVISNLLDNAIRYTPRGGRISVFVEVEGDKVITNVKDTGIGVPQASIPHLFKKFYRVSTVLKEGKKGTGLGLFISKEIVKLHKGDIWVKSKEGEGTTFSFSVPTASEEDGANGA